jgi:carboxyl-terminal processing protease
MKVSSRIFQFVSRYGWAATLFILAMFAVGFTWASSEELYSNIRLFDKAALVVSSNYVENIDEFKMIKAGIDGMLSKLDQYSRYLSGPDYLYLRQETDGEFEGIGVSLEYHHDSLTVVSVLEGTPAYNIGLKPGDRILSIDGQSTLGRNVRDVKMLLRGTRGSHVALSIHRPGDTVFDIITERGRVAIKAIPYHGLVSLETGYIRLARFSEGSAQEIREAIADMQRRGMKSLILDLRDNPGGLLLEGVEIGGIFLPDNSTIVETRGKNGAITNTYASRGTPLFPSGGLAVLVDGQTASAAEIVAGAIQDHDRGVIIGSSTFGKGLVQQVMQFTDDSALKLTTSKYYLPSGRCLQKPDWSTFELISGNVERASDSLFRTDSGRTVFGGGGIVPDVFIDEKTSSAYVDALKRDSFFFDFAVAFNKSKKIRPGFKSDGRIAEEFRKFIEAKNFKFKNAGRTAFSDLTKNISMPDDELRKALSAIDKELASREKWEYDSHLPEITEELQQAIVSQALGETALYRDVWIPSDREVSEALALLTDGNRYAEILAAH